MKRLMVVFLMLCATGVARADYEPTVVHVIVWPWEFADLSAAELAIHNLPVDQCTITEHWNTPLVIGEAGTGVALAFSPPLTEVPFYLGYLEFIVWEPLGDDYTMDVVASDNGILSVYDSDFNEYEIYGGHHVFNCSDTWGCEWACDGHMNLAAEADGAQCYQDAEVFTTATAAGSLSAIKSLY